jgi:hypothetical protein
MGYQGSPGRGGAGRSSSGRTRGFDGQKKSKTKKSNIRHTAGSRTRETGVKGVKEVFDRTLVALENLGEQTFATPPYHQHYERWLKSLVFVLDDLEASPQIIVDDAFKAKRVELFAGVEAALKTEQMKEAKRSDEILALHGSKDQLLQAEGEHEAKLREFHARRDVKLKTLSGAVDAVRAELEEVQGEKAGFFERFTKAKATREEEIASRLTSAEGVIESAKAQFAAELAKIDAEYEEKRRAIIERVEEEKKVIAALDAEAEKDGSADARREACKRFSEEINAFIARSVEKTA